MAGVLRKNTALKQKQQQKKKMLIPNYYLLSLDESSTKSLVRIIMSKIRKLVNKNSLLTIALQKVQ